MLFVNLLSFLNLTGFVKIFFLKLNNIKKKLQFVRKVLCFKKKQLFLCRNFSDFLFFKT